jgi:hypothetical protein
MDRSTWKNSRNGAWYLQTRGLQKWTTEYDRVRQIHADTVGLGLDLDRNIVRPQVQSQKSRKSKMTIRHSRHRHICHICHISHCIIYILPYSTSIVDMSEIVFCHFYLLLQILIRAKWFLIHGTLIRTYVPSKASCADPGRKQEICLRHWGRSQRNQCGFKVLLHVLSNLSDLSWTHVWYSPTKMFETVPMCLRADDSTRSCLAWRK